MLHENAKQRLWRVVPREYDLEWLDPLRNQVVADTINLDPDRQIKWSRQGTPANYPVVYLDITPQGTPRGDIGHMFDDGVYKEDVPTDDTVAYTKYTAAPQRSVLTVTVATNTGTRKIPKRVVADSIAIQCWHEFRFNTGHLQHQGTTPSGETLEYAWPMRVIPGGGGMADTSGTFDEQAVERRQFEFSLEYAYFDEEEVPATDKIEYRFGIDKDFDGEPEEWGDWEIIDLG